MAVFRVERNENYTTMSNHHLRDRNLSLKVPILHSISSARSRRIVSPIIDFLLFPNRVGGRPGGLLLAARPGICVSR